MCFFTELLKRSGRGAAVAVLFIGIVATSSVSFSSKTIALAADVALVVLLLSREPARRDASRPARRRGTQLAYAPIGPST
jgi:hypothetical protein